TEADEEAVVLQRKLLARDFEVAGGHRTIELYVPVLKNRDDAAIGNDVYVQRIADIEFLDTPHRHVPILEIDGGVRMVRNDGVYLQIVVVLLTLVRQEDIKRPLFDLDKIRALVVVNQALLTQKEDRMFDC